MFIEANPMEKMINIYDGQMKRWQRAEARAFG
jgi:hypothetical protein